MLLQDSIRVIKELSIWAAMTSIGGLFLIPAWRKDPTQALAGFIFAIVLGAIANTVWGNKWTMLVVFIGTFAGPWIVLYINDPKNFRQLLEAVQQAAISKINRKK